MYIYILVIRLFCARLKNFDLSGGLFSENFSKLSIYSYVKTPSSFTNSNKLPRNFCDKYLKSLSDRFLTNLCRLEFIKCMLPAKNKLLLIEKPMYFSNPLGIAFNFTSDLFIYFMVKWLS